MTNSFENNAALDLVDAEVDELPPSRPHVSKSAIGRLVLGLSLVLIAANLRPVFSSASALLPEIRSEFGLSALGASLLFSEAGLAIARLDVDFREPLEASLVITVKAARRGIVRAAARQGGRHSMWPKNDDYPEQRQRRFAT